MIGDTVAAPYIRSPVNRSFVLHRSVTPTGVAKSSAFGCPLGCLFLCVVVIVHRGGRLMIVTDTRKLWSWLFFTSKVAARRAHTSLAHGVDYQRRDNS